MPQVQKRLSASSIKNGGLPNITGTYQLQQNLHGAKSSGALYRTDNRSAVYLHVNETNTSYDTLGIDASRSNSIYGASSYVIPRNIKVLYCIKH